ncbi:MAG TPA: carboxypeptidase-like regulatory domain-containing protein [Thermoanaerobaculia bacterium]|jgi:hypothetical protein|nr:carboxypeptidase-like regulatory domain-containing protein [Thermoanaerobaculia bacterium]
MSHRNFILCTWCLLPFALASQVGPSPTPTAAKGRVEIEGVPLGGAVASWAGTLTLRPEDPALEPIVLEVSNDRPIAVSVPEQSTWLASLDLPGHWAAVQRIEVAGSDEIIAQRFFLWPAVEARGRLQATERRAKLPAQITLEVLPAAKSRTWLDGPRGDTSCPVDAKGAFHCKLPSGERDLALRAENFAPIYRLGTNLVLPARGAAGGAKAALAAAVNLGDFVLRRGASLVGWVEVVGGALDPKTCRVKLAPWEARGPVGGTNDALSTAQQTLAVDAQGFFQFVGVTPGAYSVLAVQPGWVAAPVAPLLLSDSTATQLPSPLRLERPLELRLTLDPPRDWLGRQWTVDIWRDSNSGPGAPRAQVFQGPPDAEGLVRVKDQSPGMYSIFVADSRGNKFFGELHRAILDPVGAERRIELDFVTVKGRLRLGDEPLAATLWFGGRFGAPGVQFDSDEEGVFHGALPKAGSWKVEIQAAAPQIRLTRKIEVEADSKGLAEVTIDLPDTLIFGSVVNEKDQPAAGASINIESAQNTTATTSNAEGRFEVRGFDPGPLALLAEQAPEVPGSAASETVRVTLQESSPLGPLVLHLRENQRFEGQVLGDAGPVAGASLVILTQPRTGAIDTARTGLDGRFAANLSATAQRAVIVVSPPGNALRAFDALLDGTPLVLRTSAAGGTLEVTLPEREEIRRRNLRIFVFQNGLTLPMPELYNWAVGNRQEPVDDQSKILRIPKMAEGLYDVCLVPYATLLAPDYSGGPAGSCVQGQLTAGSVIRLKPELGL